MEDLADLHQSLRLLRENFLAIHGAYPVVIFHDGLSSQDQDSLRASCEGCSLSFAIVDLSIPRGTSARIRALSLHKYLGYGEGYRGMCRFFSGPVYDHPAIAGWDWYMRLDVDSFLLSPLPLDPFVALEAQGASYGYIATGKEEEKFATHLWANVSQISATHNLSPRLPEYFPEGAWDRSFYYTNFEVSRLDFWRSDNYRSMFRHLDEAGGFYLHRWGDGPVHLLAVALLLEPSQVLRFDNLPYWHQTLVIL